MLASYNARTLVLCIHTGSITAPVTRSMGAPECTASVANSWVGVGARDGVSNGVSCSWFVSSPW